MNFNEQWLEIIDERIAKALDGPTVAMATLVDTPVGTNANVIFDGSGGVSTSVKTFAVAGKAGDRVGLVRFGSKWTIVGTFTDHRVRTFVVASDLQYTSTGFLDAGITIPVLANTTYTFSLTLGTLAPVANDIQLRWIYPSSIFSWGQMNMAYVAAGGVGNVTVDANYRRDGLSTTSSSLWIGGGAADSVAFAGGTIIVGNTGGDLKMQAAQVVAGGTSWVLNGSFVRIQEM